MKSCTLALLLALPALLAAQSPSLKNKYPPPGRLVNIEGQKFHLIASGKGKPTVVLVAGSSAYAIDWTLVQSRLDSNTRVISYDRAGLGWSDPGQGEEIVEAVVKDLHRMLLASGEKGPYILVAASVGGIFIQAYQDAYPNEVAGMVFSNCSNRIDMTTKTKTGLIWELTEEELSSKFPIPPSPTKKEPATHVRSPFDRLPEKLQEQRLWLDQQLQSRWDTTTSEATGVLSWRREFLREFNQSDSTKGSYPLGKLPIVVVASQPKKDEDLRYSRDGAAARLDYLSSNSIHLTALGSGHEIHLYQPEMVVRAVQLVLAAVRHKIPLKDIEK